METRFTIGLLVDNSYGVLNRITGLYTKRGFNIDSLVVGATEDENFSRMTIVSTGDAYVKEQMVRQLQKLHNVKKVALVEEEVLAKEEHMMLKLKISKENQDKAQELILSYRGKIIDFGEQYLTSQMTAASETIDQMLTQASNFGILEVYRFATPSMVTA